MKEKIILVLTDLDDYELTLKQFVLVIEKIVEYYIEKDMKKFKYFIEQLMSFFYLIYRGMADEKGEDDEN